MEYTIPEIAAIILLYISILALMTWSVYDLWEDMNGH